MSGLGDVWGFIPATEELFGPCCQDNDSLIFWDNKRSLLCLFLYFFSPPPPVADIAALAVSSAYRVLWV